MYLCWALFHMRRPVEAASAAYAHVAIDAFNVYNGLALDVPRDKVDFVEMVQYGMMNTHYLYDFLNMGFKLTPSAGSERLYAQIKGPLTAKSWGKSKKRLNKAIDKAIKIYDKIIAR